METHEWMKAHRLLLPHLKEAFVSCSQFCSKCSFCQCFPSYTMFAALVFYLSEQLLDDQAIFTCCTLLFQGSPPPLRPPWRRRHSGGNHLWCLSPWPRSSSCSSPRSSSHPPSPHLWASRRWASALLRLLTDYWHSLARCHCWEWNRNLSTNTVTVPLTQLCHRMAFQITTHWYFTLHYG